MGRVIEIAHGIRLRLNEVSGIKGSAIGRFGDAELARVLPLISREEWVFICIVDLTGTVQNDGSSRYNGLQGYSVRNYLREVGIGKWAELFESLYPFARQIDEIEGDRQDGKIADDEYDVLVERINLQMDEMETAADVEDFDEMDLLLLKYAVKHGFGEVAAPDRAEDGGERRK